MARARNSPIVNPPDPQKLEMNMINAPIVASSMVVLRVFFIGGSLHGWCLSLNVSAFASAISSEVSHLVIVLALVVKTV